MDAAATLQGPAGLLEGCWETEGGTREVWQRAPDGWLFGYNVALQEGRISFFEQLRVERSGEDWVYVALPRGRQGTVFTLVKDTAGEVSFANPDHDYPQLITYRVHGDGLEAEIALIDGTEARTWQYGPCPQ